MSYWSNIEISHRDPEIIEIDKFEQGLGELSEDAKKIRELIRRFEICHFKYKEHLKHVSQSIQDLCPKIEPTNIGVNHVSKGKEAFKNDKTGRSILGQRYIGSLMAWLGDYPLENPEYFASELNQKITKWLGKKDKNKERIVRLLIARLMWDWGSYKQYQKGGEYKELEFQVCRMDICHYAFPKHLDLVIQGIGQMEAVDNFEGCGSYNSEARNYAEEQFLMHRDYLESRANKNNSEKYERIKIWLIASLAKTLQQQAGLKLSLPSLNKH